MFTTFVTAMAGIRRPHGRSIVDAGEILALDDIRQEVVTLMDLAFQDDPLECMKWLAKRGLLRNSLQCDGCQAEMNLVRRAQLKDGYNWKCAECEKQTSVRKDSFFSRSHLALWQILAMIYGWSRDYPQKDIAHEARLGEAANHTTVDWCSFCRDICESLIDNPSVIGGLQEDGTSKIVEIDESKFFHRKYHRGQWREGHWVFGGIERGTGKCFMVEVENRNADTLTNIIQQYILPGSIIMSDGWRDYNHIDRIGGGIYEHKVVIHEHNFVDPEDRDTHTQNIENMWMCAKRKIHRQFGTSENLFPSYLHEFIWRSQFRQSTIFAEFIGCLHEQYPV